MLFKKLWNSYFGCLGIIRVVAHDLEVIMLLYYIILCYSLALLLGCLLSRNIILNRPSDLSL